MGTKDVVDKNTIDLSDCVIDWNDRETTFQELIDEVADIDRPCTSLGWCPYGRLKYRFPTNYSEAKRRKLPTFGIPLKCGTGPYAHHCPAFYLASSGLYYGVECESKRSENDCAGCRQTLSECPKGTTWRRRVATRDNADPAMKNWFPTRG